MPYLKVDGQLRQASWEEALYTAARKLRQTSGEQKAAIAGGLSDAESMVALKDLLNRFNSDALYTESSYAECGAGADLRANYVLNDTLAGVEDTDVILLVGTNPRYEAPVFNARIRKTFLYSEVEIGLIGSAVDLTYDFEHLGTSTDTLQQLLDGKSDFAKKLSEAKRPFIVVGADAIAGKEGAAVLATLHKLAARLRSGSAETKVLNVLQRHAAQTAAIDLGYRSYSQFTNERREQTRLLYLLGADETGLQRSDFHEDCFVIYQGHHGDAGAEMADLVLPAAAYTEKASTWVNTEGRSQRGQPAILPPGEARTDWKIIRAVSEVANAKLPYDNLDEVRHRLGQIAPHFVRYGNVEAPGYIDVAAKLAIETSGASRSLETAQRELQDFYMTNTVTRASPTMAECVRAARGYDEHPHVDATRIEAARAGASRSF